MQSISDDQNNLDGEQGQHRETFALALSPASEQSLKLNKNKRLPSGSFSLSRALSLSTLLITDDMAVLSLSLLPHILAYFAFSSRIAVGGMLARLRNIETF